MIAACPKCQTRYRLKPDQIGERGIRLRCRRCEALFRVLPPPPRETAPAPAVEEPARGPAPTASPVGSPTPVASTPLASTPVAAEPESSAPTPPDRDVPVPAILVAHRDGEEAKRLADSFSHGDQVAVAVADGAEALLTLFRRPPRLAILDAGLSALNGHQLCEVMKRSPALRDIPVVLLQDADAASRDAAAGDFGADRYLDGNAAEGGLREALEAWGFSLPPLETEPPEASQPALSSIETPAAVSEQGSADDSEFSEELARAERLARIAVSDIVLYNEEKFAAALQSGDPLQTMRDEVEEGRSLLRGRIAEQVFEHRDFVGEELLRVARDRS